MKKLLIILVVLFLPVAVIYGVVRHICLNTSFFKKLVHFRHLERQAKVYRKQYNNFQMELVKHED